MCGIVGYVGFRRASDLIVEGLRRLEYRGYDSSGLAVLDHESQIHVRKAAGRLSRLEEIVRDDLPDASIGIGHTRWATHGAPTDGNAHPHLGGCVDGSTLAVVHNGVVENFRELKARLEAEGYVFKSETDSEVIAHLIDSCLTRALQTGPRVADEIVDTPRVVAVREAIAQLRGTYGLLVLFRGQSDLLVAARLGSPLVIGAVADAQAVPLEAVIQGLSISLPGEGVNQVLAVSLRWPNPDKGEQILAALAKRYVAFSQEQRQQALDSGMRFLDQQAPDLLGRVDALQDQLRALRVRNGFLDPLSQSQTLQQSRDNLTGIVDMYGTGANDLDELRRLGFLAPEDEGAAP
jgi:glucosamine 6-phosphate synthetase-like amidotransferase/phosphosugar isomerase protein